LAAGPPVVGSGAEFIDRGEDTMATTESARRTAVEQVGDAATVRLEEDGCWGNLSFVDFFALAKIDGTWRIVNKTFAHTGGEMPAG
jgi:hypothetical protein